MHPSTSLPNIPSSTNLSTISTPPISTNRSTISNTSNTSNISNTSNTSTASQRLMDEMWNNFSLTPKKSRKRNRSRIGESMHPLSPAALRSVASKNQFFSSSSSSRGSNLGSNLIPTVVTGMDGTKINQAYQLRVHRPRSFQTSVLELSNACTVQLFGIDNAGNNGSNNNNNASDLQMQTTFRSNQMIDTPIAFIGKGGIGKTVLLRSWKKSFQRENPETSVNLVTIGETLESRDYLSVVYELGQTLLESVEKAAKAITERLVKDGMAPEGGAKGGPLDVAQTLCQELDNYLEGSLTTMHTPSEYLCGWITRATNMISDLKIWVVLDGLDFVLDKDLDGNNVAEARELVSCVPRISSVGLIVSMRDDYHMLDMWRLEGWNILTLNPWTERERDTFLQMRWAEVGCLVRDKERGEASLSLETPQGLQVVLNQVVLLGSECIEPIIEHARSAIALFDYALELWEQDKRFLPGLLPCVLTAILLSPRGSSPKDIASTYGFPLNSILELEKLAGNVLVFVDAGTIPSLPENNRAQNHVKESVLHFPNDDFAKAVALRYLGTDVIAPEGQMYYIDTRDDGLFSKRFMGVMNVSDVGSKRGLKHKKTGLSILLASAAVMNASAKQFNVMCPSVGRELAKVAVDQIAKAKTLLSMKSPALFHVEILSKTAAALFRTKAYVEKVVVKKKSEEEIENIEKNTSKEMNKDVAAGEANNSNNVVNVAADNSSSLLSGSGSNDSTKETQKEEKEEKKEKRHAPSLQEISALLHELLSSESMDMLLKEFTEGGKQRQAEQVEEDQKALEINKTDGMVGTDETMKVVKKPGSPSGGTGGKHRQFSNLQANEANAEFLTHAQDGKASSYTAAMFILRRDPFVQACQKVLPYNVVPDEDLYTLFDALDWTADSDRDGFVSWEDFVDLILISAKGKDLGTNDSSESSSTKTAVKESALQDSLVWQLQSPDPVLSFSQLASISKENRDLISNILPVYNEFVTTTHNGTLKLISEPTPDQIATAEMKGTVAKRIETFLPLVEHDLKAVTVCWCPYSRVVATSLMRRTAPSFVGLQFLEPLAHWALSPHSVHFDVHATPITALSCYYGALPSDLASSITTESFEVIFVGCEDGSLRFSELSDMIHSVEDSVSFHPRDSTSLITVIRYIPEIQQIVTCSMDGNVRLINFAMAGDIVNGLKLEARGIQGTFNWHSRPVLSIQYCKESHCFLSAGLDTTMYLWQPSNFKILKAINTGHPSKGAHLLEGTSQVVTVDADIDYRNEKLHQCCRIFNLFSGLEQQSIELIGIRPQAKPVKGSEIKPGAIPGACSGMAFDKRRGRLFIGSHKMRTLERTKIWQPSAKATHEHPICAVLFSSNHMQLTTVDQQGTARIWNVRESTLLFDFKVVPEPNLLNAKKLPTATAGCLGYAQERLFTGLSNGELSAWRIYNGGKLQEYAANDIDPIVAVQHVNDISCIVALSIRGTISFWRDIVQIDPLKCVRCIEGMSTGTLNFMSMYGDKTFLEALVGDTHGRLVVWNALSSYTKADRFNWNSDGGPAAVNPELSVAISCGHIFQGPSKSFLVTGSQDGYIRMYYLSIHRGLTMVGSVFSGGFSPPRDGSHVLGPSVMDVSEDGTEIIVGDASGGIRIWTCKKIKKAKLELDLYPIELTLQTHWTTIRSLKNEIDEYLDLRDISVSSLTCVKGRQTIVAGNRFSVKLYTRNGICVGNFGQKKPWHIEKNSILNNHQSTKEVWNLFQPSQHSAMPIDFQKAADKKVIVSPLARKLEMRRIYEDGKKEERLEKERLKNSMHVLNALALGEVKATTLDGRACANLEETQGTAKFNKLAMRSGTKNQKRMMERLERRRPLPPGTPAAIFDSRYGGKVDFLPKTPFASFTSLEKGLHLNERHDE